MKAIYLTGPNEFSLREVKEPIRGKDEVLIQVRMVGICGSDMHLLRGHNPFAEYPVIPGHEYIGEVLQAPARSKLKKGDKVTVFPEVGCGKCPSCKEGKLVHCTEFKFVGVRVTGGAFCERVAVPYQRVFRVPKQMEDEVGTMIEPTAVAVHANRRAKTGKGMKVVVIGGGTIGLLIAQVARAYGAAKVVISEPIPERRTIGETLGFRLICNPREEELPSFVRRTIGLADIVFDVVAVRKTLTDGLSLLRPDGKLMLIGVPTGEEAVIPCIPVFGKELQVVASRTYFMKDFPEAIRLLSAKKIKVKPLISEVLPIERFAEGVEHLEKEPEKYVKVLIRPEA